MSDYITPALEGLAATIKAVWPEVSQSVWMTVELQTEPFDKAVLEGKVPFAAISLDLAPPVSPRGGLANLVDTGPIYVQYCIPVTQRVWTMIGKLTAFRDYVAKNGVPGMQVLNGRWCQVRPDDLTLPANQYFIASGKPFLCGAAVLTVLMGQAQR